MFLPPPLRLSHMTQISICDDKCHNVTRGTRGKSNALQGHTQDPAALSEHNEHQVIE